MADYSVFQNQWLFATLFGGLALVLAFVLCYRAMWRSRKEEEEAEKEEITDVRSFLSWFFGIFPWAIVLAILGTTAYALIHTGLAALKTPNW